MHDLALNLSAILQLRAFGPPGRARICILCNMSSIHKMIPGKPGVQESEHYPSSAPSALAGREFSFGREPAQTASLLFGPLCT
jgi:hypothetical protein